MCYVPGAVLFECLEHFGAWYICLQLLLWLPYLVPRAVNVYDWMPRAGFTLLIKTTCS